MSIVVVVVVVDVVVDVVVIVFVVDVVDIGVFIVPPLSAVPQKQISEQRRVWNCEGNGPERNCGCNQPARIAIKSKSIFDNRQTHTAV